MIEPYHPHFVAQQFGLVQGIPFPPLYLFHKFGWVRKSEVYPWPLAKRVQRVSFFLLSRGAFWPFSIQGDITSSFLPWWTELPYWTRNASELGRLFRLPLDGIKDIEVAKKPATTKVNKKLEATNASKKAEVPKPIASHKRDR